MTDWLNVLDYGADPTGVNPSDVAFQSSLDTAVNNRRVPVYIPNGKYRLTAPINVPAGVALIGDRQTRETHVLPGVSTVNVPDIRDSGSCLLMEWGHGDAGATPSIILNAGSVLKGILATWPNQSDVTPIPYPWAVHLAPGLDGAILDCNLQNPYQAIWVQDHHRPTIRGVSGQAMFRGLFVDGCLDAARISGVHWILERSPVASPMDSWIRSNAVAFDFGRVDALILRDCFCYRYAVAYRFRQTGAGDSWAYLNCCVADDCPTPLEVQAANIHGIWLSNCHFTLCGPVNVASGLPVFQSTWEAINGNSPDPIPPSTIIIDNGETGYGETGGPWAGYPAGYGGSLRYCPVSSVENATASWTFTGLTPGTYPVAVSFTGDNTHPSFVTYRIYDGETLLGEAAADQTTPPPGGFYPIGDYEIASGILKVVLSNQSNQVGRYVVADAVRVG